MSTTYPGDADDYVPDHSLTHAYDEARLLDDAGLQAICPSYIELSEIDVRYQDSTLLGTGAVKEVYRTFDNRAKRWVAMARLREDRGPEFYDIFVHEAWLTSSLSHPNIIKIYDVGVDPNGRPFFTMDLKGNTRLADLATGPEPADLRTLLRIFVKICDAMAYAHSRGVIHRDLKPENIQTDAFGEVLVCDWGLGKFVGDSEDLETELPSSIQAHANVTLTGEIKGSPGFMAPEQAIPGRPKDHRTDIFALGCILHFILTGEPPFTGPRDRVIDATTRANVVPPRMRFPERSIPESLDAVVMKALARDPQNRYQSALELQEEIQQFLGGYSTRAENPGFLREARLFLSRNRTPAVIAFLSLVVLTVLSVLFVQRLDRMARATGAERQRAERIAAQKGEVQAQYQSLVEESRQSSKQLSAKLAKSANTLKNLGIFERPVETVREARDLASMALALDPKNPQACFELFSLDCIALNFREALNHPPPPKHKLFHYTILAKTFPKFAFTEYLRPTPEQFTEVFRKAREIDRNYGPLMERIVSYDFAVSPRPPSDQATILAGLVEYLNGGPDHIICSYNPNHASFYLWSDQPIRLLLPSGSGSGECILHYLPIRSLKLEITGPFDLADLNGLSIESLDIHKSGPVFLRKPASLTLLREIRIRPGQIDPASLHRWIRTSKKLEIVKMAEEP